MTKPTMTLFTPLYLWYKYATGNTYNVPAIKLAGIPIGSVAPLNAKYIKFFKNTTNTPANGENIMPAISAGTSLRSTFKYGGKSGNGKLIKNKTSDTVASRAITTIFVNFEIGRASCREREEN